MAARNFTGSARSRIAQKGLRQHPSSLRRHIQAASRQARKGALLGNLPKQLEEIHTQLTLAVGAVEDGARALERQACEDDEDVAHVLRRAVLGVMYEQLDRLDELHGAVLNVFGLPDEHGAK